MFSKYKGIEIPLNYSGSRFKQNAPETEMKTHKPSPSYRSTKTSVSPAFQSVINQAVNASYDEEIATDVYEIEENDAKDAQIVEDTLVPQLEPHENEHDFQKNDAYEEKKKGLGGLFDEFKPFFEKLKSSISGEDLLLLSIIILLASDGGNDSKESILPLLLLFLYN